MVKEVEAVGVRSVQLALDPIRTGAWDAEETRASLDGAGITVLSGMMMMHGEDYSSLDAIRRTGGVVPDEHWEVNLAAAEANAELCESFALPLMTFHAGFLPHEASDPARSVIMERLRAVADVFAARGIAVALETGQEAAETLAGFLEELEHPAVGVNFDPANMLLCDMGDPVASLRRLAPFVRQVHIKDALRTKTPGTWGEEVPVGDGEVDWEAFVGTLVECGLDCDLVIEREAGEARVRDIRRAVERIEGLLGGISK